MQLFHYSKIDNLDTHLVVVLNYLDPTYARRGNGVKIKKKNNGMQIQYPSSYSNLVAGSPCVIAVDRRGVPKRQNLLVLRLASTVGPKTLEAKGTHFWSYREPKQRPYP